MKALHDTMPSAVTLIYKLYYKDMGYGVYHVYITLLFSFFVVFFFFAFFNAVAKTGTRRLHVEWIY